MHAMPLEWWFRPLSMHDRDGEHSAVVCMFVYRKPPCASRSRLGVLIGDP